MKKNLLYVLFTVMFFSISYGQNLWNKVSDEKLSQTTKMERASMPNKYELFTLDFGALKSQLQQAPLDSQRNQSDVIVAFPNPEGKLNNYRIFEAPVMEDGLADKFPGMKSYVGKGIDDPTAVIRFSVTLFGLHTMTLSGTSGTSFIDTYTKDLRNYIVYNKSSVSTSRSFECLVNDSSNLQLDNSNRLPDYTQRASDGLFRVYRLAMACTIEYAAYHVTAAGLGGGTDAQKKAAVLAAMVVTMTRINGLYEKDMSLRMNLVANNDLVIFINSDTFDNANANTLINQSQTVIDANIGAANYDIGHTVSTGGGGLAQLFSPCTANKARGITGSSAPVGDPFDIDYVAHEMGHQFGARHTQNNGCNRNAGTAVEPGSGSTIMGYAGICAPNVQSNSDAHFHAVSIAEMSGFVAGTGGSCPVTTPNGNFAPVVNAGLDYTIPNGTAFILKGLATDANGDALTYCWEQTNIEVSTQPPVQTAANGPNFRSNPPITSPNRYMPVLSSVIANNLAPTWEVVPTVARTMDFALTVRDNRAPNGGQTGRDNMVVTTAAVGPFLVNSPNTNVSWTVGTNQTVTWTVAGTTANNINAAYVDIFLSTDGGNTYPIQLASKVPNDGSEIITVPNNPGLNNRVMIAGYKHIFYDISNTNFTILAAASSFSVAFSGVAEEQNKSACQGTDISYTIPYQALAGFSGTTTFAATGNPGGSIVTFNPASTAINGNVIMTVSNTASSSTGLYTILVNATSGATTKTVPFYLELFSAAFPVMALTSPANNATGQNTSVVLTWAANANANSYDVQVATDIAFANIISSGNVTVTSYTASGLSQGTSYYWRVLPKNNNCSGTFSSGYRFTTGVINCGPVASTNVPLAISASGTPTINSTLNIPAGGTISDVNISAQITHSWAADLVLTLISPAGTLVELVNGQCGDNNNLSATFDDSGTALVCGTTPAISGTIIPSQALSVLNGQSSTGTWTLRVFDKETGDGGSLTGWSLNVCTVQPLSVDENLFQDFSLYPNPNKGNFTVKFTSPSSNDVRINVHDMRGRQVYEKSFANNGAFNQTINLDNIQSGIYLVSVTDGAKKTVKRIIVE